MHRQPIPFSVDRHISVKNFSDETARNVIQKGVQLLAGLDQPVSNDVATNVPLFLSDDAGRSNIGTFSDGDGTVTVSNIDSLFKLKRNVLVVNQILTCGGEKSGILGCCGFGKPIIVLAELPPDIAAVAWMHELGHHKGLCHRDPSDGSFPLMSPTLIDTNKTVNQFEHDVFVDAVKTNCANGKNALSAISPTDFVHRVFIEGVPYDQGSRYKAAEILPLAALFEKSDEKRSWLNIVTVLGMTGDPKAFPILMSFLERGSGPISSDEYAAKQAVPFALGYLLAKNFSFDIFNYLAAGLNPVTWPQRLQWHPTIGINDIARTAQLIRMTILGLAISGRPEALSALQLYLGELLDWMAKTWNFVPMLQIGTIGIYANEVLRMFGNEIIATFKEAIRINKNVQDDKSLSNYYHNQELQQLGFNL
jgi:hypothetical protein